jgi:hypothetical protein
MARIGRHDVSKAKDTRESWCALRMGPRTIGAPQRGQDHTGVGGRLRQRRARSEQSSGERESRGSTVIREEAKPPNANEAATNLAFDLTQRYKGPWDDRRRLYYRSLSRLSYRAVKAVRLGRTEALSPRADGPVAALACLSRTLRAIWWSAAVTASSSDLSSAPTAVSK